MDRTVTAVINQDACLGCGLCITVCPSETITMREGLAAVTGDESLNCGHCAAACPEEAITVKALKNDVLGFRTFQTPETWLAHGEFDTGELVRLMRSRRSCRNFKNQPVDREMLADLIRAGVTAPSGSNCQLWTFTVLPNRKAVETLAAGVVEFFRKTNKTAEKAWLRTLLKLAGKGQLEYYYRNYYESIKEGLDEWEKTGRDRMFHGAPAAILVGSLPGASCPQEDALLATQNILLAAHAMGLGTCLVGFAVSAMKNSPAVKKAAGVPLKEPVYAVIAVGHPNEKYERLPGRKQPVIRWAES